MKQPKGGKAEVAERRGASVARRRWGEPSLAEEGGRRWGVVQAPRCTGVACGTNQDGGSNQLELDFPLGRAANQKRGVKWKSGMNVVDRAIGYERGTVWREVAVVAVTSTIVLEYVYLARYVAV